jgi:hypothetical protein
MGHFVTNSTPKPATTPKIQFSWEKSGAPAARPATALLQHPNFQLPPPPTSGDPAALIQWACDSCATFVSPPKLDGENEEFRCDDIAAELRNLGPKLAAIAGRA